MIAARIGRSPSVVSREIARHGGRAGYRVVAARRAATEHRCRLKTRKLDADADLRDEVLTRLRSQRPGCHRADKLLQPHWVVVEHLEKVPHPCCSITLPSEDGFLRPNPDPPELRSRVGRVTTPEAPFALGKIEHRQEREHRANDLLWGYRPVGALHVVR